MLCQTNLVNHHSNCPDITFEGLSLTPLQELRTHPSYGTYALNRRRRFLTMNARHSEVAKQGVHVIRDEYVSSLNVTVNDTLLVEIRHGFNAFGNLMSGT